MQKATFGRAIAGLFILAPLAAAAYRAPTAAQQAPARHGLEPMAMEAGVRDAATKTMTWSANTADAQGRSSRPPFIEGFDGDIRRFDMVALTRKGEVPLARMRFTKRPAIAG